VVQRVSELRLLTRQLYAGVSHDVTVNYELNSPGSFVADGGVLF